MTGLKPPPAAPDLIAGYGSPPLDEAITDAGELRPAYRPVFEVLDRLGATELIDRNRRLVALRDEQGLIFAAPVDGTIQEQVFPLDPVPRIIGADTWAHLTAGAAQRARALNAFLADVYGGAGAHADRDRPAEIVADGIIPDRLVRGAPGYLAAAAGLVADGVARAAIYGLDLLTDEQGRWVVLEDNLQVPSGIAYALANRRTAAQILPELQGTVSGVQSPEQVGALFLAALQGARPPRCGRSDPQVAVLSDGPTNSAWFEHHTLATEMGVPILHPDELVANGDGVGAIVDGQVIGIDVLYRRVGNDELIGKPRSKTGELLRTALLAGTVSMANAPGNGVADDKAIYAFVGPMIQYYLGEAPLLDDVGTWVLADPGQFDAVRGRMGELVVKPVDGSGGEGVMIGPDLSNAEIAALETEVAKAPQRYIAQDVVRFSTHPTLVGDRVRPRHVDLRMFALSSSPTSVVVPPIGLTRVALQSEGLLVNSSQGGGSKDTWVCH